MLFTYFQSLNKELTKEDLAKYLRELGYIGRTIIPQLDKFTENKKFGAFPHPISVAIGPFGKLFFLSWDSNINCSKFVMTTLHNPVQNFVTLKENTQARCIYYCRGVVYLYGSNASLSFLELKRGTLT
jgi:hypothetical protein